MNSNKQGLDIIPQAQERWTQGLQLINQINQILATVATASIEQICQTILHEPVLDTYFKFDRAEIALWDSHLNALVRVVQVPETLSHPVPLDEGYTGWLLAQRKSLLVNDTHQDSTAKNGDLAYRSLIGTVLTVDKNFMGILKLGTDLPNAYDAFDLVLLETVAGQMATAIEQAKRLTHIQQQHERRTIELAGLERVSQELNSTVDLSKILDLVLHEAMRATRADLGCISIYNAHTRQLQPLQEKKRLSRAGSEMIISGASTRLHPKMTEAFETRKTLLITDCIDFETGLEAVCSLVVVPIIHAGEAVGIINLESQHQQQFTANQLSYLEALANQAAVGIGNAKAFDEQKLERHRARRWAEQMARLSEISNAFRTNRRMLDVLEDIAYAVVESVGYKTVILSLIEGRPPTVHPVVGAGVPVADFKLMQQHPHKPSLASLEPLMDDTFYQEGVYFVPANQMIDWRDKINLTYLEGIDDNPTLIVDENVWHPGDLLFVPLTDIDHRIIGLMFVDDPDNHQRPDHASIQVLEVFANHAAIAIENARLFELEQKRHRLANTLRDIAETISSQLDFDELQSIVLQELKNVVSYDSASVQLLQGNQIVIIGGQGWEDSYQFVGHTFSMSSDNPSRKVLETQEPLILADAATSYPAVFGRAPFDYIHSWLGVPLTYGTNVLGLISLSSKAYRFFTTEDVQVVSAFANQVAVALQNAHLFDEARQQVRQMTALTEVAQTINRALNLNEVLNQVLDAVFDLVGHEKGSIWLIDSQTQTVKIANTKNVSQFLVELFNESAIPTDVEPFASVIKSGKVSVIAGSGSRAKDKIAHYGLPFPDDVTYVPLQTDDSVIGILAIETVIHNKTMLQLVSTLADLAAVAIENARLVERLNQFTTELEARVEQRTQELAEALGHLTEERDRVETLYRITREITASLDLDRVLTEALNLIDRAIGVTHGSILFLDHGTNELIYRAALGRSEPLPSGGIRTSYKLGHGLAGQVMKANKARIVSDLSHEPAWVPSQNAIDDDRCSAIAVPLATTDGMMGALLLFHSQVGYFTEDHLRLVNAAGSQIANAINNAELYRLITDQAERLGTMLKTEEAEAAKNQAILNGITDGVLVLNAEGCVVLLNPKAGEILAVNPTRVEGQPVQAILEQTTEETDMVSIVYDNLLNHLESIRGGEESAQFRVESGPKTVVVTLSPLTLGIDAGPSVVAVVRDISREAEIDRLKNEFIATVSHELRTPLTSIKGYTDLLAAGGKHLGELNPMQQKFVQTVQSNANRLTNLVNEILEISRIETGRVKLHLEPTDLVSIVEEVATSFEGQLAQKAMDLTIAVPDTLPAAYADKTRVTQVLVNLIGNAWQYTPEGGKITVDAMVRADGFIQIDVADSGIGIPEQDVQYVFDRFFRSERTEVQVVDGTGLGLSITKSLVDMMGGDIWVESELDVGTTFSFTVPLKNRNN